MDSNLNNFDDLLYETKKSKVKKRQKIVIFVIALLISIIIIIIVSVSIKSSKSSNDDSIDVQVEIKLNNFLFFDPVTDKPCNEDNYWTPFDNSTTCYRFVSLETNDTINKTTIRIMMDHNIGRSNYTDYKKVLKQKTSNWKRFKGDIDIVDKPIIHKIMKAENEPTITASICCVPTYYTSNSEYIIQGKIIDELGYWTKTIYENNTSYSYAITKDYRLFLGLHNRILGIRPVLEIKKSLLQIDSGVIEISDIIKNGTKIEYEYEKEAYDGYVYKALEGFTVTNDKLIFMSVNNNNPEKSIMYSYQLNDLKTLFKKDYNDTGHGNGLTYNSKLDKVLIAGPNNLRSLYMYNGKTLEREKVYSYPTYPIFAAIGYDYINDLYVGYSDGRIFLADTEKFEKLYQFRFSVYEVAQDIEFYNGYLFDCLSDPGVREGGPPYSFYGLWHGIIYVYNMKLDKNKKHTKDFGRLTARLHLRGFWELESISFRDNYVYFGFADHSKHSYVFYKVDYLLLEQRVKKLI